MHTTLHIGQFFEVNDELPTNLHNEPRAEFYQLSNRYIELLTGRVILLLVAMNTGKSYEEAEPELLIEESKLFTIFHRVTDKELIECLEDIKLEMLEEIAETYSEEILQQSASLGRTTQIRGKHVMPEDDQKDILH